MQTTRTKGRVWCGVSLVSLGPTKRGKLQKNKEKLLGLWMAGGGR